MYRCRTAASTLLTWLAQPQVAKAFAVDCRPRTPHEAALAAATPAAAATLPATVGWFRACTAGAAAGSACGPALAMGAAAAAAGGGAAATGYVPGGGSLQLSPLPSGMLSLQRAGSSLLRGPSESLVGLFGSPLSPAARAGSTSSSFGTAAAAGGSPVAGLGAAAGGVSALTPGLAGGDVLGGGGAGEVPVCSEYSGQLAERLYSCAHHALVFLAASSPQVGGC